MLKVVKKLTFSFLSVCCLVTPALSDDSVVKQDGCLLNPVFVENFEQESISASHVGPARWIAHTPWKGDFGDAQFADPGPGGPFKLQNGRLSILATKGPDGKWKSGLIAAADASGAGAGVRWGYFEARMKLPPGTGTWPAFWLMPLKPAQIRRNLVEIDVMEYYGNNDSRYQAAIHIWREGGVSRGGGLKDVAVQPGVLFERYHNYGVDISPEWITFFYDDKIVWQQSTPAELDGPLYPIVNLALGSGWPIIDTPSPSALLVEYVHVYRRAGANPEHCSPGLSSEMRKSLKENRER